MKDRRCSFKLQRVSEADVLKVVKSLKNSSATGVDYIDTRTVKLASDILTPALTHIINLSISSSTFPKIWKYAKVIPLLKSFTADPLLPKSYRPVALRVSQNAPTFNLASDIVHVAVSIPQEPPKKFHEF